MLEYDKLFIGNRWVTPASESVLEVRSPATLALVGRSPDGSPDDMDHAVLAARDAFDTGPWPAMSFAERAAYLDRILDALRPRGGARSAGASRERHPVCFSSGSSGFPLLEYYSELGRTHPQEELRPGRPGVAGGAIVRHAPAGVVAAIVPWNGPVMQILMKMAPALVAGCTLVIKPSPETPLSCTRSASRRRVRSASGVVSIVPGGREAGSHLVSHPAVDRVSFTGSTAAGKQIAGACAPAVRRVSLELGGKSAAILLDDLDLDRAIPTVVNVGMFFNGEACSALTRCSLTTSTRRGRGPVDARSGRTEDRRPARSRNLLRPARLGAAARACRTLRGNRTRRGRRRGVRRRPARGPRRRLVCRTDDLHQRQELHAHRAGRGVRPRHGRHSVRRRGRCGAHHQRI